MRGFIRVFTKESVDVIINFIHADKLNGCGWREGGEGGEGGRGREGVREGGRE